MEANVLDKTDEKALVILRQFADGYEVLLSGEGCNAFALGGLPLYVVGVVSCDGMAPFRRRWALVLSVEPLPEGKSLDAPMEYVAGAWRGMTLIVLKRQAPDSERRRYTERFPVVSPHCYEILEVRECVGSILHLRATGIRSHYVSKT